MENSMEKTAFPRFVVERTIKSDDTGRICLVRSPAERKRYIYRSFTGSGAVYRRMVGIECSYLPKIYDVFEDEGKVHILEEYIQGDTLAFLLDGHLMSQEQAEQIIIHLCRALQVLHGIGAVHRDIKPENIILRGSDAVLIDFDASRLCKTGNDTDTRIMGTTGYAAPEQYGFSQTDGRTDIYSLGIVLNEMLTGQHPSRVLAEGMFRPIIEKCTRINADQRYANADELLAAIEALHRSPRPFWVIPVAIFAALALCIGGIALYRSSRPQPDYLLAEKVIPTVTPTEASTEATTAPTLPRAEITTYDYIKVAIKPWEGDAIGRHMDFTCDMDGDGTPENYRFCIRMTNMPYVKDHYYDICDSGPNFTHERILHAYVWRLLPDGTTEPASGFAENLTDVTLTIYRVDDLESHIPRFEGGPNIWPGYAIVTFSPEQSGTWLYEMKAMFGELELTATYTSTFRYR